MILMKNILLIMLPLDIEAAQESGNELSDECNFEPIPENDDS